MRAIEFSSSSGRVRISWKLDGVYFVAVDVKAHGFRGHSDCHVESRKFKSFAKKVSRLAKKRQGEATLKPAFSDFFEVTIRSVDGVGHLGIFGSLWFQGASDPVEKQELHFSLNFEPSQIEVASRELGG